MSDVTHPCHACGEPIDALAVLDGRATDGPEKRCPECHTPLRVLRVVADGYVDREDLAQRGDGSFYIPDELRAALAEQVEAREDPAERNDYLAELGVVQ